MGVLMMAIRVLSIATVPGAATASVAAIDDSGTFIRSPVVQMRWQAFSPRHTNSTLMTGATVVQVRLNVAPWLRRTGRIYLVLPAQSSGPIHATWTTQGRLFPGEVNSGERALVYSGLINTPQLEEVLQPCNIDFRFEMETS
jgi:hypothetical protein